MSTRIVYFLLNDSNDSLQEVYQKSLGAQARIYGIEITVILVRRTIVPRASASLTGRLGQLVVWCGAVGIPSSI